jgi:hypothetical protein
MPTLADIYSAINTAKRKGADFLQNPGTSLQQMLGDANDRARQFNQQNDIALKEFLQTGKISGPQQMELAQQLASGYNPGGMTVWHGSPYKFAAFDPAKIGTGEGAQAYGHGLYVAQNPAVAKGYQKTLSEDSYLTSEGKSFNPDTLEHLNLRVEVRKNGLDSAVNRAKAIAASDSPSADRAGRDLSTLQQIQNSGGLQKNSGALYKVDLPDEHIAKMLDWDNPVPDAMREKVNKTMFERFGSGATGTSGEKLYKEIQKNYEWAGNKNPALEASNFLQEHGIPGVRYLDADSRRKGGTSNFVVFPGNEHMLQIQDINGNPLQ